MSSNAPIPCKAVLISGAFGLALAMGLGTSFQALADDHYVSLRKFFPNGKCTPVIPNFELMKAYFAGGEFTDYKIRDNKSEVIETISTFINKDRDQWVIVGSKRDEKVLFCLYASGNGQGSVDRQTIKSE
jgi:hypothetical protein